MDHRDIIREQDEQLSEIESSVKRIKEASELLGIKLLDHIVIGDGKYDSIFSRISR